MNILLRTPNDALQAFLRVALGLTIFPHGAQKLLGWFGGNGYRGHGRIFRESAGRPACYKPASHPDRIFRRAAACRRRVQPLGGFGRHRQHAGRGFFGPPAKWFFLERA